MLVTCDADADLLQRAERSHDLLDTQPGCVLEVTGDREGGKDDGQVGLDRLSGVVEDRGALRSVLLIRNEASTCHRSW